MISLGCNYSNARCSSHAYWFRCSRAKMKSSFCHKWTCIQVHYSEVIEQMIFAPEKQYRQ
jgi:hypothetical protein